jgi:hypothetical protein
MNKRYCSKMAVFLELLNRRRRSLLDSTARVNINLTLLRPYLCTLTPIKPAPSAYFYYLEYSVSMPAGQLQEFPRDSLPHRSTAEPHHTENLCPTNSQQQGLYVCAAGPLILERTQA